MRRRRLGWRARVGVALMTSGAVLAGCTATDAIREVIATPRLDAPADPATVLAPTAPVPLAVAASAALYTSAPVVVLAADGDAGGQAGAASAAVALGAPMLLTPGASADPADATAVAGEVARLGPQALLAVGQGAQEWAAQKAGGPRVVPAAPEALAGLIKVDVRSARAVDPSTLTDAVGGLDRAKPELLTVAAADRDATRGRRAQLGAGRPRRRGRARPSRRPLLRSPSPGWSVLARSGSDRSLPRPPPVPPGCRWTCCGRRTPAGAAPSSRCCRPHPRRRCWRWAAASGPSTSSGSGSPSSAPAFSCPEAASWRSRPADGRPLRHPGTAALGSLGEQDLNGSITRVKNLVAQFQPHSDVPVVPAFEIITTVAAGRPGADGDYSTRSRSPRSGPTSTPRRPRALRDARPAAGPHRLPDPGQALPGAARGAARRPRARPGVATAAGTGAPRADRVGERRRDQPGRRLARGPGREPTCRRRC